MTPRLSFLIMLFCLIAMGTGSLVQADGELLGFAVVSEVPKDKARISAKGSPEVGEIMAAPQARGIAAFLGQAAPRFYNHGPIPGKGPRRGDA